MGKDGNDGNGSDMRISVSLQYLQAVGKLDVSLKLLNFVSSLNLPGF